MFLVHCPVRLSHPEKERARPRRCQRPRGGPGLLAFWPFWPWPYGAPSVPGSGATAIAVARASRATSATAHYMAAPPLRGPSCQRWEGVPAVGLGSAAGSRWGNAGGAVASLLNPTQPSSRLMTGYSSSAIARRVALFWGVHLSAGAWSSAYLAITGPEEPVKGSLCKRVGRLENQAVCFAQEEAGGGG